MRSRPDPLPESFVSLHRRLSRSSRVRAAIRALQADPGASLRHLSAQEQVVVYAELEREKFGIVSESYYDRAWRETTPVCAAPQRDDRINDLLQHSLGQPEMQEAWRRWTVPYARTSTKPDYAYAKAVAIFCAASGLGKHVTALASLFDAAPSLGDFFAAYDHQAQLHAAPPIPGMLDALHVPPLRRYRKSQLRQHMIRLAPGASVVFWRANIEMFKALRDYFDCVGRAAFIDGTGYPAWARQIWGGEPGTEIDTRLRGRDANAGYRAYAHGPTGKFDIDEETGTFKLFRYGRIKSWRGFYWIVIVDCATGLPLIGILQDASINEYLATEKLLDMLHRLWPDIGLKYLIADAGWDNSHQAKLILTKYDAQPVFRASDNIGDHTIQPSGKSDQALLITSRGEVMCRHGKCAHVGMPAVSRDGLAPGEPARKSSFRIRVLCPRELEAEAALRAGDRRRERDVRADSCGKLSVRCDHHWARTGHLPHHGFDRPDLFALRQVLIARLPQVESFIGRVKSLGLANPGPARARFALPEADAYMTIGSTTLTALTLADQRERRGVTLHLRPGGKEPVSPRESVERLLEEPPDTVAVGNEADDPYAARRAAFRVIPGGLT